MVIPDQFRDELKKRYHTCTELFRHFWSSLNPRCDETAIARADAALLLLLAVREQNGLADDAPCLCLTDRAPLV